MRNQQEMKRLSDWLNFSLIEMGIKGTQKTYKNLKPTIFPFGKTKEVFTAHGINVPVSQYDFNFAFLDVNTMEELTWKTMTLIHKFGYRKEFTDCDNFAFLQSVLMAFLFGINTCGASLGKIYNAQTGATIGGHYFNTALTYEKGKFGLYCCDPLNPGFQKVEQGKPIIINNWRYIIKNAKFF